MVSPENHLSRARPWEADVEVSEALAESLIAAQFPELAPVKLTLLGEGWDGKTFELDGHIVFRFPKRSEVARALDTEIALLPQLAEVLPIAVPRFRHLGRASSLFPYRFVGYAKIPGVEARRSRRRSVRVAELAPILGDALTKLHAFPEERARAAGATASPSELSTWRSRAEALFAETRRELPEPLAEACAAFLAGDRPLPRAHEGPPRVVHNALSGEHLLLDPETGALSGMIDWNKLALGDPAIDLAGVYAWMGTPLLEATAASYRGALDEATLDRARFLGVCFGVSALAHGIATGDRDRAAGGVHALSYAAADGVLPR